MDFSSWLDLHMWLGFARGIWGHEYSCGPASYALVYSNLAMAVVVSAGGVFVWRRFIRSKPAKS